MTLCTPIRTNLALTLCRVLFFSYGIVRGWGFPGEARTNLARLWRWVVPSSHGILPYGSFSGEVFVIFPSGNVGLCLYTEEDA